MRSSLALRTRPNRPIGFTIPEVLTVIAVIALLIAVLLPALTGAMRTAGMAKATTNLKQIALWMTSYSADHRDNILPSQFDYTAAATTYPVKVRSDAGLGANRYKGTWTDILWTLNGLGETAGANATLGPAYEFDSPDQAVYDNNPTYEENVFRAPAPNTRDAPVGGAPGPTPFGAGAQELSLPGYLAANNFFNTTAANNVWYTTGQIKKPNRSLHVVDSYAGETIEPNDLTVWDNTDPGGGNPRTIQVDFRYNGACLILFLDGHVDPMTEWTDLTDLQTNRRVRIQDLTNN